MYIYHLTDTSSPTAGCAEGIDIHIKIYPYLYIHIYTYVYTY